MPNSLIIKTNRKTRNGVRTVPACPDLVSLTSRPHHNRARGGAREAGAAKRWAMGFAEAMDLERPPPDASPEVAACSICLDPVVGRAGERSTARLQCGHEFHLDCIGSAFNAKGAMQCPNCRKIENGRWLYANGHRPSSDFDIGDWVTSETYDIISDHPFGFRWCPFSGFTPLASVFEESESEPTSFGDHSSAASSSLVCPYLATHGFQHPVHVPSGSTPSTESIPFHRSPTGMEGHATADLSNIQGFHEAEPRNHERERQYLGNLPVSGIPNYSTGPFGIGIPRYDGSNQQRSRPYMHAHSLLHRPTPRSGSSPVAQLGSAPAVVSEARGHGHGMRGHVLQQTIPSTMPSNPYPPTTRRVRPRPLSITSFIAASSPTETGGGHDFSLPGAANTTNSNLPNGEGASRHSDRLYSGGWETFWTSSEGEPHGWGYQPVHNQAYGSSARRSATQLLSMYGAENGYPPVFPQRMPPFL